jgi:hypothetical protein
MSDHRPRWRANGQCGGCGQRFIDLYAFLLHASGRIDPPKTAKRRCRDAAEMRALGMVQRSNQVWVSPLRKVYAHERKLKDE